MEFRLRWIVVTVVAVLASLSAQAGELAVLQNGFIIRFERRQSFETVTRLYFAETRGSYVDIPTDDIARFEAEELSPPPASPVLFPAARVPLSDVIRTASAKNKLDPELVTSVIRAESAFDAGATSPKGAQGLMQLMPLTASALGVRDPLNPVANVEAGTFYLRQLMDRYSNDLIKALAAYNAGPNSVDRYQGVPPYAETRAYVARIIRDFNRQKQAGAGYKQELRRTSKPKSVTPAGGSSVNPSE